MKDERNYKMYDKKDLGFLLIFSHQAETDALLYKKDLQLLIADILEETNISLPYFIEFSELNNYCKG